MHSRLSTVEKWDMLEIPYMLLTLVRVYALYALEVAFEKCELFKIIYML
jgi:hypothetical protein